MLETIVARVRERVSLRSRVDWEREIAALTGRTGAQESFVEMLSRPGGQFICEIKRKAPSNGELAANIDILATALAYQEHGAAAISVLTEDEFFGGSLEDLKSVSASVTIPTLRKDFVVDSLQIHEAAANGASAVLLIVAILSHQELREFLKIAQRLGLDALIEVHDEFELSRALAAGAKIIGVNNRNLKTMEIDLATGERILKLIPSGVIKVAESGLRTRADVIRMRNAGADAFLIGTSLMTTSDIGGKIREFRGL